MRVSTKYAPRKAVDGKPLSCTTETTLKPEQHLELYRYLKLTRLVEERLVNLYRQTKVVGGVFRSLGQEATAVGTAYALQPHDFVTPYVDDLAARFAADRFALRGGRAPLLTSRGAPRSRKGTSIRSKSRGTTVSGKTARASSASSGPK